MSLKSNVLIGLCLFSCVCMGARRTGSLIDNQDAKIIWSLHTDIDYDHEQLSISVAFPNTKNKIRLLPVTIKGHQPDPENILYHALQLTLDGKKGLQEVDVLFRGDREWTRGRLILSEADRAHIITSFINRLSDDYGDRGWHFKSRLAARVYIDRFFPTVRSRVRKMRNAFKEMADEIQQMAKSYRNPKKYLKRLKYAQGEAESFVAQMSIIDELKQRMADGSTRKALIEELEKQAAESIGGFLRTIYMLDRGRLGFRSRSDLSGQQHRNFTSKLVGAFSQTISRTEGLNDERVLRTVLEKRLESLQPTKSGAYFSWLMAVFDPVTSVFYNALEKLHIERVDTIRNRGERTLMDEFVRSHPIRGVDCGVLSDLP